MSLMKKYQTKPKGRTFCKRTDEYPLKAPRSQNTDWGLSRGNSN